MPRLPTFNLQQMASDAVRFATSYPAIAANLGPAVGDPFTERVVEGVRYLAGVVLDRAEEFRANAYDLLADRVSPWIRRPFPSATVVAFDPPPAVETFLPKTTTLRSGRGASGHIAFCPLVPVRLQPCAVTDSVLESPRGGLPTVRITVTASGATSMNEILANGLDLYIDGELDGALHLVHALTSEKARASASAKEWVEPVRFEARRGGLDRSLSLSPDPNGMAAAFGVVTEAWLFPHKFRFIHVKMPPVRVADTGTVVLNFKLSESLPAAVRVEKDRVRTNAAVVSNLFRAAAEPLPFDPLRGPMPIRVVGKSPGLRGVYSVLEARVVDATGQVNNLPDARRLAAPAGKDLYPGIFAVSIDGATRDDPNVTISFGSQKEASDSGPLPTVSMSLLATNRTAGASLRPGELAGSLDAGGAAIRFRNVVAPSRYIPPAVGDSLALRALRWGALGRGPSNALEGLRACLHRSVPTWVGNDDSTLAFQLRIDAIRSLEAGVARTTTKDGTVRRGYGYRMVVDEAAFRGPGEVALFGAAIREALARGAPVRTFVDLDVVGLKTNFSAAFRPEPGAS